MAGKKPKERPEVYKLSDLDDVNPCEPPETSAAGLSRIVLLRMVPMSIVAYIPFVGGLLNLVDILFIFGRDRRCIHDLIADTIVVQA